MLLFQPFVSFDCFLKRPESAVHALQKVSMGYTDFLVIILYREMLKKEPWGVASESLGYQ